MLKQFIFLFTFILVQNFKSQVFDLKLVNEYNLKQKIKNWTIDNIGNIIIQQGSTIIKIDSTGKHLFTQSIKSIGEISQISTINSMKLVLFSEEQQCLCLLDNTLTINGKCKYLDQYNIKNAKFIATSNRPNHIWIFDQYNTSIFLIDIIQDKIIQKVENFAGIAGINTYFTSMQEYKNNLYLEDKLEIYEFDFMLNWKNSYPKTGIKTAFWNDYIVEINQDKLNFRSFNSNELTEITFDSSENQLMILVNAIDFYFSSGNKISKFRFNSTKF